MARIFVTGATGFVGGHFVRAAMTAGHDVIALKRPDSKPRLALVPEPTWVDGDLQDFDIDSIQDCDVLVHLASKGSSPQQVTWQVALQVNVMDSLSLWQMAATAGVGRFVIAGSGLEYGTSTLRFDPIPANAPLEPQGNYALSKATSSIYARSFCISHKVKLAYVRMFNLYGEGQFEGNFYPSLCQAAKLGHDFEMTSGTQIRDFDTVENAVKTLLYWVDSDNLKDGMPVFVNHGSGSPRKLVDYATQWWSNLNATGKLLVGKIPDRRDEVRCMRPDLTPIMNTASQTGICN